MLITILLIVIIVLLCPAIGAALMYLGAAVAIAAAVAIGFILIAIIAVHLSQLAVPPAHMLVDYLGPAIAVLLLVLAVVGVIFFVRWLDKKDIEQKVKQWREEQDKLN